MGACCGKGKKEDAPAEVVEDNHDPDACEDPECQNEGCVNKRAAAEEGG